MKTTPRNYAEALASLLETQPVNQKLIESFVKTLRKAHQEKMLNRILALCERILMQRRGEIKVAVITARELETNQMIELKKMIEQSTGRTPIIEQKIEKGLAGGVKLAVGDYMIDSTIFGRLQALARALVNDHGLTPVAFATLFKFRYRGICPPAAD